MKPFASDNNSGIHPKVLEAIGEANKGSYSAYGNDMWTDQARELFKKEFGSHAKVHFVTTGTSANILGLRSALQPYECVVTSLSSHLHTDECGAFEAVTGCKLLFAPSSSGKLSVEDLPRFMALRGDVHSTSPKIISLAQVTELGTAYTLEEIEVIASYCKANNFYLHMDGARLSNAAATFGVSLQEITKGVDILSFGGAKNGLMNAESVVFLNPELGDTFGYFQKQGMHLGSKMRFLAAQFITYLTDELWRNNAEHANAMAKLLATYLEDTPHTHLVYAVEGNAVFVRMPKNAVEQLVKKYYFYVFDPFDDPAYPKDYPMVRFMTSFDSNNDDILAFIQDIRKSVQ